MNVYLVIFISITLMFFSCNNNTGIESSEVIGHQTYEMAVSPNGKHTIYSYIDPQTGSMEVSTGDTPYDESIYYNLDINNSGDYAFCAYSQSNSNGSVFLNGVEIYRNGLYNDVILSDTYLFVNYERLYDDMSFLLIYNIFSGNEKKIQLPYFIRNPLRTESGIYYEAFDKKTEKISLVYFDFDKFSFSEYSFNERAYIVGDSIVQVCTDNLDSSIFVNAIIDYVNHDPNIVLGEWNNHLGRLSWHISYRMRELLELRRITGLTKFDSDIINLAENLLSRYSEDRWCTKKYSIDGKQKLYLMADCGMILNSLLEVANAGVLSATQINYIKDILKYEMEEYESDWNNYYNQSILINGGGYIFRRNIPYTYDGIVQPFNQQNIWLNCMIEGYFLTDDIKYKNRAISLMTNFINEFVWEGNNLLWHYWPQFFYDGWSEDSNLSKNTPYKEKTEDTFYEDLSHAAINVLAIHKFLEIDPKHEILDISVIDGLESTLTSLMATRYSRFLKPSSNPQYESFEYFPHGYWSLLQNHEHKQILAEAIPSSFIFNNFDQVSSLTYLLAIDSLEEFNIQVTTNQLCTEENKVQFFSSPSDFVLYLLSIA